MQNLTPFREWNVRQKALDAAMQIFRLSRRGAAAERCSLTGPIRVERTRKPYATGFSAAARRREPQPNP